MEGRPGEFMEPLDFAKLKEDLQKKFFYEKISDYDVLSAAMYPKVFDDYLKFRSEYGKTSVLPTRVFLQGPKVGERLSCVMEKGRAYDIKVHARSNTDLSGHEEVFFEVNGQPRSVYVPNKNATDTFEVKEKADRSNVGSVGAPMPGQVLTIRVEEGDFVKKGDPLVNMSAMKMETVVSAPTGGMIKRICIKVGDNLAGGDLLLEIV